MQGRASCCAVHPSAGITICVKFHCGNGWRTGPRNTLWSGILSESITLGQLKTTFGAGVRPWFPQWNYSDEMPCTLFELPSQPYLILALRLEQHCCSNMRELPSSSQTHSTCVAGDRFSIGHEDSVTMDSRRELNIEQNR